MYYTKHDFDRDEECLNLFYVTPESYEIFHKEFDDWEHVKHLHIYGDFLPQVTIPNGVESFVCINSCLRSIEIPDTLTNLHVIKNKLKHLELPANIQSVFASNNILESITFRGQPSSLNYLELHNNRLHRLEFIPPPTMSCITLRGNQNLRLFNVDNLLLPFIDDCTLTRDSCFPS